MTDGVTSRGDIEHKHDVGDEFEAPHKGRWKVTNRMFDVDTGEVLYCLRDIDSDFNDSEILTEGQIARIYDEERNVRADTEHTGGDDA